MIRWFKERFLMESMVGECTLAEDAPVGSLLVDQANSVIYKLSESKLMIVGDSDSEYGDDISGKNHKVLGQDITDFLYGFNLRYASQQIKDKFGVE